MRHSGKIPYSLFWDAINQLIAKWMARFVSDMLQQRSATVDEEEAAEMTAKTGTDPAVMAAGASVLLSWYYFFARDNRELGLFIGLWPPTLLAFASYFRQTRMSDTLESSVGGGAISQFLR